MVRSARAYHIWWPDLFGELQPRLCVEYFVPDDTPQYVGDLPCGSPQWEVAEYPRTLGGLVGDRPYWVRGDITTAYAQCGMFDTGAYDYSYGSAWDSIHVP